LLREDDVFAVAGETALGTISVLFHSLIHS